MSSVRRLAADGGLPGFDPLSERTCVVPIQPVALRDNIRRTLLESENGDCCFVSPAPETRKRRGSGSRAEREDVRGGTAEEGMDTPLNVGVLFAAVTCCAAGMHNVVAGLFRYLKSHGAEGSMLYGIVGGPEGLRKRKYTLLDKWERIAPFLNKGGQELLGYSSFMEADLVSPGLDVIKDSVSRLRLDALVVVGGADSLCYAHLLSKKLREEKVAVVGVPQSRNNHVYHPKYVPMTLGFDSARKTLSEFVGNICIDAMSSKKYWHIIRCGDAAVTAEVALMVRPTLIITENHARALIEGDTSGELDEVSAIVQYVASVIESRVCKWGLRSGVVMVSQNVLMRLPTMTQLREELSSLKCPAGDAQARRHLTSRSWSLLRNLPKQVKMDLLRKRDEDGRPVLSYFPPEEYLARLLRIEMSRRSFGSLQPVEGGISHTYGGPALQPTFRTHYLGYESRCPVPTSLDCSLGLSLGATAGVFACSRMSGYVVSMMDLHLPIVEWKPLGVKFDILKSSSGWIPRSGCFLRPSVFEALKRLEKVWASRNFFSTPGPVRVSPDLTSGKSLDLPFTLLADYLNADELMSKATFPPSLVEEGGFESSLENRKKLKAKFPERCLPLEPELCLPVREERWLSALERSRLKYQPVLPDYFWRPYRCVEQDVCARVCPDLMLLEEAFPHMALVHQRTTSEIPGMIRPSTLTYRWADMSEAEQDEGSDSQDDGSNEGRSDLRSSARAARGLGSIGRVRSSSQFPDSGPTAHEPRKPGRAEKREKEDHSSQKEREIVSIESHVQKPLIDELIGRKSPFPDSTPTQPRAVVTPGGISEPYDEGSLLCPGVPGRKLSVDFPARNWGLYEKSKGISKTSVDSQTPLHSNTNRHRPTRSFLQRHLAHGRHVRVKKPFKGLSGARTPGKRRDTSSPTLPAAAASVLPPPQRRLRVGVVFMCSQVPGCHNIVAGLFDYLQTLSPPGVLLGFLGGALGLLKGWSQELSSDLIDRYRNQGGQDLLCHFGENISCQADLLAASRSCQERALDGLVIIGGLQAQLDAALLAEYFMESDNGKALETRVVGVPASVESEIPFIPQSVGYDTVTKVLSSIIANLACEARSSARRWYFVRLIGRAVSHLVLESALSTHPNIVLLSEEVAAKKQSLAELTSMICDVICHRSAAGKNYGVVLVPDGLVAHLPEMCKLLAEIDRVTMKPGLTGGAQVDPWVRVDLLTSQLNRWNEVLFKQLPRSVQVELLTSGRHAETDRLDAANIAIEKVLQTLVSLELYRRRRLGSFNSEIDICTHALAYQGRSSMPTNFDCDLAYCSGWGAGILLDSGLGGLLVAAKLPDCDPAGTFKELEDPSKWKLGGIPLVSLLQLSRDGGLEATDAEGRACMASLNLPARLLRKQSFLKKQMQLQHEDKSFGSNNSPSMSVVSEVTTEPACDRVRDLTYQMLPIRLEAEPVKLVLHGNICQVLFDVLPPPVSREYRQPGPVQLDGRSPSWQLCLKNFDASDKLSDVNELSSFLLKTVCSGLGAASGSTSSVVMRSVIATLETTISILQDVEAHLGTSLTEANPYTLGHASLLSAHPARLLVPRMDPFQQKHLAEEDVQNLKLPIPSVSPQNSIEAENDGRAAKKSIRSKTLKAGQSPHKVGDAGDKPRMTPRKESFDYLPSPVEKISQRRRRFPTIADQLSGDAESHLHEFVGIDDSEGKGWIGKRGETTDA